MGKSRRDADGTTLPRGSRGPRLLLRSSREIDKSIEEGKAFVSVAEFHAFQIESKTARAKRMSKIRYHADEHVGKVVRFSEGYRRSANP